MTLNWNIEVFSALLGFIFFLTFSIIFLKLGYSKRNKAFLSLFLTFTIFTAFHFFEATAYLFLSFELKRMSAMMYSLGFFFLIFNVDIISKERLSYYKIIVASFIIGSTVVLALIPENVEFYYNSILGYPTLGVAGFLQIINTLALFLLGFQLVYFFFRTWQRSPIELKKKAYYLFITNIIFYCCILVIFSLGLHIIFPVGYIVAVGSISIVTFFIAREPKLLHILSFTGHRLTVITNESGIPLFNLSWDIKSSKLKDEQRLLAKWLPLLQQLSQRVGKSLLVEEIKLKNEILLFRNGDYITAVLLSEKSTPALRESLDNFTKSFEKKYFMLLKTGMTESNYYNKATDLIEEFFPLGIHSVAPTDSSLDSYLEKLVKKRTLELEQISSQSLEADHLKSLFLASMSHELRTPLNSIIGFSELLLLDHSEDLSDTPKQYISTIYDASYYLLNLINGILDLSKIEAGKFDISVKNFSFNKLLFQVTKSLKPKLSEKNLELEYEIDLDINLSSDEDRLKQILFNLIGNAIKFSNEGGKILIRTKLFNEKLNIHVIDNGIGISRDNIHLLFAPFQRVIQPKSIKTTGTGLGLYLTKKLVNLLGGNISVESEEGKGTDFYFNISTHLEIQESKLSSHLMN
jgi:signal transduction histidine kinase